MADNHFVRLFLFSFLFIIKIITGSEASVVAPKIKLNNGIEMPVIGLGTWKSKPGEVTQAVKDAIDAGYRHIDCAWIYGNEKEVGEGIRAKIREGVIKREDLFIVSKLWDTFHRPEDVEPALKQSLNALGLNYLDLYLIHGPTGLKPGSDPYPLDKNGFVIPDGVDYVDTWKAMEEVYKKGLTRSIGVSNFNKRQIERLLNSSSVVPVTNQVECHPYLNQKRLMDFCKSKGIVITAYSPLGSGEPKLLDDPNLKAIASKHRKTPAQIILRYLTQRGLVAIPKSVHKNRIQENINIFDFQLSTEDMKYIDSFNRNGRLLKFESGSRHPYYPFHDEY